AVEEVGGGTVAAVEGVVVGAAGEEVHAAVGSEEEIGAGAAVEVVRGSIRAELVGAERPELVVATSSGQRIRSPASVDHVLAAAAMQLIVPGVAIQLGRDRGVVPDLVDAGAPVEAEVGNRLLV